MPAVSEVGGLVQIRVVLFDVGGPIATEIEHERAIDEDIRSLLAAAGVNVDDRRYVDAWRRVVDSFAPNAYKAVVWTLSGGVPALASAVYGEVAARSAARLSFELRPGIADVLAWLRQRGLLLGLAANQPAAMLPQLDRAGVGRYFAGRGVAGTHGFHKPDVRLFLHACSELGVTPDECIMVGDRVDCDIVPARLLSMRTVLYRTGRHAEQQPRSWDEQPDAEVGTIAELRSALQELLAPAL